MTITASAAAGTFWQGLRLVVLDTETTETPDGTPRRCVSVGAVTCRHGTVRSRWQRLVDPGIPIDLVSHSIHHISNDHLAGEAGFEDIADELLALLEPRDGETVIIAAHNVGFDISVLRYERQQTDRDLPDLPVLDTMGPLVALAGIELHRPSLNDLLAELGLVNRTAHDALADAEACAAALLVLLERAADRGHSDRDELLAELGTATTHRIKAGSRAKLPRHDTTHEDLPPDHVEGHRDILSARAGNRMLAAWRTAVTECAVLRCGHLTGRVERAEPEPLRLVGPLTDVLDGRLVDHDTAGAATALAALTPLLDHLAPLEGHLGKRRAFLEWAELRSGQLAALGRCSDDDGCPACRAGEPCALDLWPDTIAQLALGDPKRYARGFFEMTGKEAGTGAYTSWLGRGLDQRVCDAALCGALAHRGDVQAGRAGHRARLVRRLPPPRPR